MPNLQTSFRSSNTLKVDQLLAEPIKKKTHTAPPSSTVKISWRKLTIRAVPDPKTPPEKRSAKPATQINHTVSDDVFDPWNSPPAIERSSSGGLFARKLKTPSFRRSKSDGLFTKKGARPTQEYLPPPTPDELLADFGQDNGEDKRDDERNNIFRVTSSTLGKLKSPTIRKQRDPVSILETMYAEEEKTSYHDNAYDAYDEMPPQSEAPPVPRKEEANPFIKKRNYGRQRDPSSLLEDMYTEEEKMSYYDGVPEATPPPSVSSFGHDDSPSPFYNAAPQFEVYEKPNRADFAEAEPNLVKGMKCSETMLRGLHAFC